MKRIALFTLLALVWAAPTFADFDQGMIAYRYGDFDRAMKEFRKDAVDGHALAQFNLGVLYFRGEGAPRDPVEAYAWIELATQSRGDLDLITAQEFLIVVLEPEQVVDGLARAERLAKLHDLTFRPVDEDGNEALADN